MKLPTLKLKVTKSNFFRWLTSLQVIFIVLYLFSHILFSERLGRVKQKLSAEDITVINSIDSVKGATLEYLIKEFSLTDPVYIAQQAALIEKYGNDNYLKIIGKTGIIKQSFFWLDGDWALVELVFWSLFGALCSFFYYYAENKKKDSIKENEFATYISKLYYGPFVTIIIYLVPNIFSSDSLLSVTGGYSILVFAFILGFFSGRAIELLDKIKNLIFPYAETKTEGTTEETPDNVPEPVLREAIMQNATTWKNTYGVLDVSVGIKKIKGIESNIHCLIFRPVEKKTVGVKQFVNVPATIAFTSKDGNSYEIPTDVQDTGGDIVPTSTKALKTICDSTIPRRPGCSVSRLNSDESGTIGLKVFKNGRSYILSCYHVLCAPEMDNGVLKFDPAAPAGGSAEVISPSKLFGGLAADSLATVTEGKLDEFMDCAIAEITEDLLMDTSICGIGRTPTQAIDITIDHARARYVVQLSGRTSGQPKGRVKSSFASADISYEIGNRVVKREIQGLIVISSIASGGDSGGIIVDEDCNIVGIVIASSPTDSYVVPISTPLIEFNLSLK